MSSMMVLFTTMRFLGMAHYLTSHQKTIGVGVGLSIASGMIYFFIDNSPSLFNPSNIYHLAAIIIPQQVMFCSSVVTRGEATAKSCGLFSLLLVSLIAARIFYHFKCESRFHNECEGLSIVLLFIVSSLVILVTSLRLAVDRLSYLAIIWSMF